MQKASGTLTQNLKIFMPPDPRRRAESNRGLWPLRRFVCPPLFYCFLPLCMVHGIKLHLAINGVSRDLISWELISCRGSTHDVRCGLRKFVIPAKKQNVPCAYYMYIYMTHRRGVSRGTAAVIEPEEAVI